MIPSVYRRVGLSWFPQKGTSFNPIDGKRTTSRERARIIRKRVPDLFARLDGLGQEGVISDATGPVLIKRLVFEVLAANLQRGGIAF